MKPRIVSWIHVCVLLALGIAFSSASVSALNTSTHRLVNRLAAQTSVPFDEYLRGKLGFSGGPDTGLRHGSRRLTIQGWLEEGGDREDDLFRSLRHFHDPLKPWETAGLDLLVDRHDSSVRWMQQPHQAGASTGGFWSWRDARRLYYEALTEPDPALREALWADLFRALGQIMHLVVDASVPEHTRNDMHPLGGLIRGGSYEYWVSGQHQTPALEAQFIATYLSAPIGFLSDILTLTPPKGEIIATVPVARLIDADRYDGTNPSITVNGVDPRAPVSAGLAEIANANFFSEDTLRGQYPSPTDAGLIPVNLATPLGRVRRYLTRPLGLGLLPANPLRAECASDALARLGSGEQPPLYPCMDGVVWGQVAAHMLPRAVGYARGVLDYFFRDSVRVAGVWFNGDGIWIDIENISSESMEGVFEVYARRHKGSPLERRDLVATLNGGAPASIEPGGYAQFPLELVPGEPLPYYVVVFRGRLGAEADAVTGHVFAVPHVAIVQRSYQADVTSTCKTEPPIPAVSPLWSQRMICLQEPFNHRAEGRLVTNFADSDPGNPSDPAIESIQAFWRGGIRAPLIIDGVEYSDGLWRRRGQEPDPESFTVTDPAVRGTRQLWIEVRVRESDYEYANALVTFDAVTSISEKTLGWILSASSVYVKSSSLIRVVPNAYPPNYRVVSIGGHAVPTRTERDQLHPYLDLWRDVLVVRVFGAERRYVDQFQTFPIEQLAASEAAWHAIELTPPFSSTSALQWSAVVVPSHTDGWELEYHHRFVAVGDPPSYTVVPTAQGAVP